MVKRPEFIMPPKPLITCTACGRMVFPWQGKWCDTCYGIYHDEPRPTRELRLKGQVYVLGVKYCYECEEYFDTKEAYQLHLDSNGDFKSE